MIGTDTVVLLKRLYSTTQICLINLSC